VAIIHGGEIFKAFLLRSDMREDANFCSTLYWRSCSTLQGKTHTKGLKRRNKTFLTDDVM
jgi:hypothetical protein